MILSAGMGFENIVGLPDVHEDSVRAAGGSWPVATETVDLTGFGFTLDTGDVVFANGVGMWPNWELNERNVPSSRSLCSRGATDPSTTPGGPGPEPFEDVRYTAPGPRDLEPVIIALDDSMRVDREAP